MLKLEKILVLLLIATFLASIPLSLANSEPEITVTVDTIEIGMDYGKPPGTPGAKPDKPDRASGDYKLMGVKWYDFDLTLYVGDDRLLVPVTAGAEEWDNYANENLVQNVVLDTSLEFDTELQEETPDYRNELIFDDLDSGIIAVCYTWSIGDRIIQFDIAFNTDYLWGDATTNSDLMDLQNIATHEIGHGFGLANLYKRKLSDLTMYGYASEGETIKRDLAQGDIDGIQALYGVSP